MKITVLSVLLLTASLSTADVSETTPKTVDCVSSDCPEAGSRSSLKLEGDELVKKYCISCHTESRIFDGLRLMRKQMEGNYAQGVKSIVVKKIRLTGGNITRQDGKKILEYLVTL